MNKYLILIIIIVIIALALLIYMTGLAKFKELKEKMEKAESIIDSNLTKKLEIIISLNTSIKKVTGKKDYLKDFVAIKDQIVTNIEKDLKLDEAEKLINDLKTDYNELNTNEEFLKEITSLREVDELLVSAKNLFNQSAIENNKLMKNFPYNIISKIGNFRKRSYYNNGTNNKTDDSDF